MLPAGLSGSIGQCQLCAGCCHAPASSTVASIRKFTCEGVAGLKGQLHSFTGTALLGSQQPKVKAAWHSVPSHVAFLRPQLEGLERDSLWEAGRAQADASCPGRQVCRGNTPPLEVSAASRKPRHP